MAEIYQLTLADVLALHEIMMERFGRAPAPLREEGLLESAIMRPRMVAYYSDIDLVSQCAILTVGISQAQAFLDGNKRTAYAACDVFLRLNGLAYTGDPLALAVQLEMVAQQSSDLEEATEHFAQWLRGEVSVREE